MRTVSTLCASGAGIGVSVLGFSLAADDHQHQNFHAAGPPSPGGAMSATATATYAAPIADHFAFAFPPADPYPAARPSERFGRSHSENAANIVKRKTINKTRGSAGMADSVLGQTEGSESSRASTPNAQSNKWLRRFSGSIPKSRDSSTAPSRAPTSRPASAAISYSNGSFAFSHTGSTTPMLPSGASASQARNRLVKRSSSARSVTGSPFQTSGSRLPLATFKRPATSHQRSATLHEHASPQMLETRVLSSETSSNARNPHWRHYFTPKVARAEEPSRKLSMSSIPNPIKRIYPDRRYTPTLVSAQQEIRQAGVEADDESNREEAAATESAPATAAPSPMPSGNDVNRRSFNFSNLLPRRPSPLSHESSSTSKSQINDGKLARSASQRVASAPQSSMGASVSASHKTSERRFRRRNVSNIESSSHLMCGATRDSDVDSPREIQLNLNHDATQSASTGFPSDARQQEGTEQRRMPSATAASNAQRLSRLSATVSEITALESDNENRSIGDASTDYQSDAFDSFPTRTTTTTRSSSGKRGPPIETIFDDSPPRFSSGRSTKLRDLLNTGGFPSSDSYDLYRYSTIEEEDSIATPKRSLAGKSVASSPSARPANHNAFSSSPPAMHEMPDPDDIDWDASEDFESAASSPTDMEQRVSDLPHGPVYKVEKSLPLRLAPPNRSQHSSSATSTPRRNGPGHDRATIFDWAEIQPSPSHNNSPPRPKTVHGKKEPDNRGSRKSTSRARSGMHTRSHSVPVVPDADGSRNSTVANKFGTWGVGSKGVTEDWNEDFDFEDSLPELPAAFVEDKRIDSGHAMLIPKSIQEQQENVVANIGLLREWGLLIEELKDLRIRAAALGMLAGPLAKTWGEVEAMIDLADQESHEATLEPRRSPPSSPGFDDSAFEEPMREAVQNARARARSVRTPQPTITAEEDAVNMDEPQTPSRSVQTRPRKDSQAVARSVIEALQTKRTFSDPTTLQSEKPVKKVPFDTATLRHIVPYVKGVKRKIKDALCEAEGLYTSPNRHLAPEPVQDDGFDFDFSDDEPSFHSIFTDPRAEMTPERQPLRRIMAFTDNDESEEDNPFGTFG